MSSDRLQLARTGFEAWFSGDMETVEEIATEDVEFVPAIAAGVEGGSVRGFEEGRRFLEAVAETWETFKMEGEEFHAVGEQVVITAHLRAKGRASGVELDHPISNVVWFREGKVARVESFLNPEQALDAAAKDLDEAGR
jgi:ketosteroid isomerase-like protein